MTFRLEIERFLEHPMRDEIANWAAFLQSRGENEMRLPRASGVLLHPTSLPGRHGIGDLGEEAHAFVGFLAETGQRWWQMLPLGPTGYGNSPYQSHSSFAGNPLSDRPGRPGRARMALRRQCPVRIRLASRQGRFRRRARAQRARACDWLIRAGK